jgi:hypothetical protein
MAALATGIAGEWPHRHGEKARVRFMATSTPIRETCVMPHICFLLHWLNLTDLGAEESLYGSQTPSHFAGVDLGRFPASDETTMLNFRHQPEQHDLCVVMLDAVNRYLRNCASA